MPIAYLSNRFPEPLESYVGEEISELRGKGCRVLPCSVQRPTVFSLQPRPSIDIDKLSVCPLHIRACLQASCLCIWKFGLIADLVWRAVRGPETILRRFRPLVHTWLGAYLATLLRKESISHLHIHHGYFASWVGMVAARLLDTSFSLTLHGSDLLVRSDYLDPKLKHCRFCVTVSEFNRLYISGRFPQIDQQKIFVQRLGVDPAVWRPRNCHHHAEVFSILSVGRLNSVKNHGFLLLACQALKAEGGLFHCIIAGEGEECARLEYLINELDLGEEVTLRGHVPRKLLPELYAEADVVVLTSHSEGIPVTLMEAMAMERIVLAPKITGIPELVTHGINGFLYTPNSVKDFLAKLQLIRSAAEPLETVRQAARPDDDLYSNTP